MTFVEALIGILGFCIGALVVSVIEAEYWMRLYHDEGDE